MIVIDGRQSTMEIGNFANLEEVLVKVMSEENMDDRIVTDVFLNKESFSELYPHQSEDIEVEDIQHVDVRTVSINEMAYDVATELFTVVRIMQDSAKSFAEKIRISDVNEGLEILQDILDVSRHFLSTITVLNSRFPLKDKDALQKVSSALGALLEEMCEVMRDEDWFLLADLMEYEFAPSCENWRDILSAFTADIDATKAE
ncbi:hypothetical protein FACS1894206_03890 [Deltaproteobacteria bacterium]|nr:hypothetical protein FACS1894206_03890 [Deltaproteobacteria bacterium]